MTPEIEQKLEYTRRRGPVYTALRRDNHRTIFLPHVTAGSADIAHTILDETLNKPGLSAPNTGFDVLTPRVSDPTSCFELPGQKLRSVVKAVAASAVEFWCNDVGHIDVNMAVKTSEDTEAALDRIQLLGKASVSKDDGLTFIAVEAGLNLTEAETAAAQQIYSSLQALPAEHFRVAIIGISSIDPVAEA